MPRVSTYLNFAGTTEAAFAFYQEVFGTGPLGPVARMGDLPRPPGAPALSDAEQRLVLHVQLPILAGHVLMGTDLMESNGQTLRVGNTTTIHLELEDRAETERLFAALAGGGSEVFGMQEMPWGAYWGVCLDRFQIRWMFSCSSTG